MLPNLVKNTKKYLFIIFIGILLDQATKFCSESVLLKTSDEVNTRIYQGSRVVVWRSGADFETEIPHVDSNWVSVQFNYVRNHGAAWGILRSLPESVRLPIFHGLTLLFCTLFMALALSEAFNASRRLRLGMCLVVSGALGNFTDRLLKGFVVDMIDIKWQLFGWLATPPVFNIADIFVVFGLLLMALSAHETRASRESTEIKFPPKNK